MSTEIGYFPGKEFIWKPSIDGAKQNIINTNKKRMLCIFPQEIYNINNKNYRLIHDNIMKFVEHNKYELNKMID